MKAIRLADGFRWEKVARAHARRSFHCGEQSVDEWLSTKALQQQEKRLSNTSVLLSPECRIAGYYTIAVGQVDFSDLPPDIAKRLPKRALPVAVLAWMGVDSTFRRRGLGELVLSKALRDCYEGGQVFPFVAVLIDCLTPAVKAFYQRWDFREAPGRPLRLFLSATELAAMMTPERPGQ